MSFGLVLIAVAAVFALGGLAHWKWDRQRPHKATGAPPVTAHEHKVGHYAVWRGMRR